MRIVILYHPQSDHSRLVEEFGREITHRNPELTMDAISVDTREGADMATVYSVDIYPTLLAIRENGELAQSWQGIPLPLMSEIEYFALS
jgi:hypothetical protein